MWITDDLESLDLTGPSGVTIGGFDGVHRGHQALVRAMVEDAHASGTRAVVVTFDPLPLQFFAESYDVLLTSVEERTTYLEGLGVDGVVVLTFDRLMANTSAHDFITLMTRHLHIADLWAGPDFALGHDRMGNGEALRRMGNARGFALHTRETFCWQGVSVRSTRIRDLLHSGDVALANELLGHPYRLTGYAMHKTHNGNPPTFPRTDLRLPPERLLPAAGAYICQARSREESFGAIAYVHAHSTSGQNTPPIEIQLLDATGKVEEGPFILDVYQRLHPIYQFATTQERVTQLCEDRAAGREWLDTYSGSFNWVSTEREVTTTQT